MQGVLVFSSCTKGKDDSVSIEGRTVHPSEYIHDRGMLDKLLWTREQILCQPKARRGARETYAFDLYVRKGRMYKKVYEKYYSALKQALLAGMVPVTWLFLSGAYGIVNALEPAQIYQATFSYQIARQEDIPYTAPLWRPILTNICAHVLARHPDWKVYVFGSQDYTCFLRDISPTATIIESTGSAGPTQLSPVLQFFVEGLLAGQLSAFDKTYPAPFVKLGESAG